MLRHNLVNCDGNGGNYKHYGTQILYKCFAIIHDFTKYPHLSELSGDAKVKFSKLKAGYS